MNHIGQRIRRLRKDRRFTQEEIAELVGVSQALVSKWENGDLDLGTEQVVKLSRIFDVTTDHLLLSEAEIIPVT